VYYHTPLLIVKMTTYELGSCQVWSVWGYEYKCLVEPKKTSNRALQDSADSGLNFQILNSGQGNMRGTGWVGRWLMRCRGLLGCWSTWGLMDKALWNMPGNTFFYEDAMRPNSCLPLFTSMNWTWPGTLVPVVHTYNPSYLEGWNSEDYFSRPTQANSLWDPHL
jgi:hypothetical protein